MKTVVLMKTNLRGGMLAAAMLLMVLAGKAQTYTTLVAGNWSSPATWLGGTVPPRTITAAMTVNIKHAVNCNLTGDLVIAGKLNIVGDTLRFPASFDKKTIIEAGGLLVIRNGGYLQDLSLRKCEMNVNGGQLIVENARVDISKNVTAAPGSRRMYRNTTVRVGEGYEIAGSSVASVIDTIQNATVEVGVSAAGNFVQKDYTKLRVANAKVFVRSGDFRNEALGEILVLPGAVSSYGFNQLKVKKDLENKGAWDARIDAHCVEGQIKGSNMAAIDLTRSQDCTEASSTGNNAAPELVFKNPVLKSGTANRPGAVYRFSNIAPGIDAEVKLSKFSRNDIVMQSIDLASMGWDKAFQPQFGLTGLVQPNQNWFVDFEMTFYQAGTNQKQKLAKVDMTALDVDGDGLSIREYAVFENPTNIIYSTVSYLTNTGAGLAGQSFTCSIENVASPLSACLLCGGDGKTGLWNLDECTHCDATGLIHSLCGHAFAEVAGSTVQGPVENFVNIDTLSTQVMATYQYVDRDRIKFRYGARSGSVASNGAGVRLNSLWFRQFSMMPPQILPVKISSFTATLDKKNVNLSWQANEENFSHYVLQRSEDGTNFTDVALIFSNGGTGMGNTYKYKDQNVQSASGILQYRLLMVDLTKESAYSVVKVIRLGKESSTIDLTVYPNPVQRQLRVTLPASWQQKQVVLEVFNSQGLRLQGIQVGSASQTETLDLSTLPKGVYVVSATCNGEKAQQRVIKQ
jgi:hypothetical protein